MYQCIKYRILCLLLAEGKAAMAENPGVFNKTASKMYKELSNEEMKILQDAVDELATKDVKLTKQEVHKAGRKIFEKIQVYVSCIYQTCCLNPV